MLKADQIPDAVVEAARTAWLRSDVSAKEDWRAAIAAALAAWPNAKPAWFLPQGKVYMLPAPWENPKPKEGSND